MLLETTQTIIREISADLETPISVYMKVRGQGHLLPARICRRRGTDRALFVYRYQAQGTIHYSWK